MNKTLHISASNGTYDIVVGTDLAQQAATTIQDQARSSAAFLTIDDNVPETHISLLIRKLEQLGVKYHALKLTATEAQKTLSTYEKICTWMQKNGAERTSPLVAIGGGIVGDITGFAAATYQRGIPFIQMPTTLLSMVDSSVGGKVAVNFHHEKNMLGSFYQPVAVFADIHALSSLETRQLRCGLSECIKHGIIGDSVLFDWIRQHIEHIINLEPELLVELVSRNIAFKAAVVEDDPKERGRRALLNLGHTFGHALEHCDQGKHIFHGEAVSIGVVAACKLSDNLQLTSAPLTQRVEEMYAAAQLPVRVPFAASTQTIVQQMKRDKKSEYQRLKLIIPVAIGNTIIRDDISPEAVEAAVSFINSSPH